MDSVCRVSWNSMWVPLPDLRVNLHAVNAYDSSTQYALAELVAFACVCGAGCSGLCTDIPAVLPGDSAFAAMSEVCAHCTRQSVSVVCLHDAALSMSKC